MKSNIEKNDDFNVSFIESKLVNKRMEVWIKNIVSIDYAEKCIGNFETKFLSGLQIVFAFVEMMAILCFVII